MFAIPSLFINCHIRIYDAIKIFRIPSEISSTCASITTNANKPGLFFEYC